MPHRARRYRLEPWIDLAPHLEGRTLISLSLGPRGTLYALALRPPIDYREQRRRASFAKIRPDEPNNYLVLHYDGHTVRRFPLSPMHWNYHFVQPLAGGELLLVCGRSQHRAREDYDRNAYVFGGMANRNALSSWATASRRSRPPGAGSSGPATSTRACLAITAGASPLGRVGLFAGARRAAKSVNMPRPIPCPPLRLLCHKRGVGHGGLVLLLHRLSPGAVTQR